MTLPRQDFCTIEETLDELRAGRMIVLVDDEYRENEGDLVIAAEKVTPESVNFMLHNARGIVCWSARVPCGSPGRTVSPRSTC